MFTQACEQCPEIRRRGLLLHTMGYALAFFFVLFVVVFVCVFLAQRHHSGVVGLYWKALDFVVWCALTLQLIGEVSHRTPQQVAIFLSLSLLLVYSVLY